MTCLTHISANASLSKVRIIDIDRLVRIIDITISLLSYKQVEKLLWLKFSLLSLKKKYFEAKDKHECEL